MGDEGPILPGDIDPDIVRRARTMRRIGIVALVGLLVAGAVGLLGPRQGRVAAQGGGYRLAVAYPSISRPGLVTAWRATVQRAGGFDGPVRLATTARYFDLFDVNAIHPDPASSGFQGDLVIWEFDPPEGDTLTVSIDARMEPTAHQSVTATTSVLSGERPVATVRYETEVRP